MPESTEAWNEFRKKYGFSKPVTLMNGAIALTEEEILLRLYPAMLKTAFKNWQATRDSSEDEA